MLEKSKHNLESERDTLSADLKDTASSLAESEKRRRAVESQLSEAQSHVAEDTAKIQELTSQNDKMKVQRV